MSFVLTFLSSLFRALRLCVPARIGFGCGRRPRWVHPCESVPESFLFAPSHSPTGSSVRRWESLPDFGFLRLHVSLDGRLLAVVNRWPECQWGETDMAFSSNQNQLAQKRGDAEKSKIEPMRTNKACAKQSWCNPAGNQSCPVKGSRPAGMNVGASGDNEWCEAPWAADGQP